MYTRHRVVALTMAAVLFIFGSGRAHAQSGDADLAKKLANSFANLIGARRSKRRDNKMTGIFRRWGRLSWLAIFFAGCLTSAAA